MALEELGRADLMTDRVVAAVRAAISSGEMPAGYRLRVRDLAARLGTSVMPVREAISRLEEAGLAERIPHRGAAVRALDLQELLDVYAVRRVLEVEAARAGAAAVTPADLEEMEARCAALRAAVDRGEAVAVLDQDEAFLGALYRASRNPVLTSTIASLWERCRPYKVVGARTTLEDGDRSVLWRFQEELLRAAHRADADLAAEVTRRSVDDAAARIRVHLAPAGGGAGAPGRS